ncbi:MAG: xanthine dehydrogenase small subunit, partial [Betaproteobacteria bacterium]|nr:xanthine dehydrogenase small subunit [Betaproteobacteria bacterium]
FVSAVRIPLSAVGATASMRLVASYKVAKRFDQDISAVCAGFAIDVAGGRVVAARIAYGGMSAVPQRAAHLEAALMGKPWTGAGVADALPALPADFKPISDMRASGEYRLRVAGNLLLRLQQETPDAASAAEFSGASPLSRLAPVEGVA